ncbi:MAG: glycosyltransferase [Oligoflexia bacterium]|nr:glycosyltransferase [Oligoflexia bacterium]
MKISVVVVNSGRDTFFKRALQSLADAQDVEKNFKYQNIVVFNGVKVYSLEDINAEKIFINSKVRASKARNEALKYVNGEWVYFLDDDAFLPTDFFKKFSKTVLLNKVDVIGGPNITPIYSSYFQKLSGQVLASYWGAGPCSKRYSIKHIQELCDESSLILCNLFIRIDCLKNLQFKENLFCGEENFLLNQLRSKQCRMLYAPTLFVFHERRENLLSFCFQIFKYGVGRGQNIAYINNWRIYHLFPSLMLFLFITTLFIYPPLAAFMFLLYLLLNLYFSLKNFGLFFLHPLVHFFYALGVTTSVIFYSNLFPKSINLQWCLSKLNKLNFSMRK